MSSEKLDTLEAAVRATLEDPDLTRMGDALVLRIAPEQVVETLTRLRDGAQTDFKQMIDLTGVHYPQREKPFEVVYQLLSVHKNHRLRVKVAVGEEETMPTVTGIWSCANWFERETYEMFGVLFTGHPDLRRLLTDYDFEGYPLRKDFPLTGEYELFYDEKLRRVVRKPNELSREKLTRENRLYYQPDPSGSGAGQ